MRAFVCLSQLCSVTDGQKTLEYVRKRRPAVVDARARRCTLRSSCEGGKSTHIGRSISLRLTRNSMYILSACRLTTTRLPPPTKNRSKKTLYRRFTDRRRSDLEEEALMAADATAFRGKAGCPRSGRRGRRSSSVPVTSMRLAR